MALQPGLELAFRLHLFLKCFQCRQARRQIGVPGDGGWWSRLPDAAPVFQLGHSIGCLLRRQGVTLVLGFAFLAALQSSTSRVSSGTTQSLAFGVEALTAGTQATQLLVHVAALGGQHLQVTLYLGHLATLCIADASGGSQRLLQTGHALGMVTDFGGQCGFERGSVHDCLHRSLNLLRGLRLALAPLVVLTAQFGKALFDTLPPFHHVADALFKPADLQRGFSQATLGLMQGVAGSVVRLANLFELGLRLREFGHAGIDGGLGLDHLGLDTRFFARGVTVPKEPELVLLQRGFVLQRTVFAGDLSL